MQITRSFIPKKCAGERFLEASRAAAGRLDRKHSEEEFVHFPHSRGSFNFFSCSSLSPWPNWSQTLTSTQCVMKEAHPRQLREMRTSAALWSWWLNEYMHFNQSQLWQLDFSLKNIKWNIRTPTRWADIDVHRFHQAEVKSNLACFHESENQWC